MVEQREQRVSAMRQWARVRDCEAVRCSDRKMQQNGKADSHLREAKTVRSAVAKREMRSELCPRDADIR